jgi:hypothetical protein
LFTKIEKKDSKISIFWIFVMYHYIPGLIIILESWSLHYSSFYNSSNSVLIHLLLNSFCFILSFLSCFLAFLLHALAFLGSLISKINISYRYVPELLFFYIKILSSNIVSLIFVCILKYV